MKSEQIQQKIDQTLGSLDNVQQAEASPFLYNKIMGRMQSKSRLQMEAKRWLTLSWELSVALLLFIGLNIATFVYFNNQKDDNSDDNSITSLANEYTINSSNYNYY